MNLWDTLKGVQGLLVSFSPLSDKKPVSDTNPIMVCMIPHMTRFEQFTAKLVSSQ
jgi:hypothetical protein